MRDVIAGAIVAATGGFILLWLIPAGISAPSNLPNAALSPTLWPRIVAAMLIVTGLLLALQGWRRGASQSRSRESAVGAPFHASAAIALLLPYFIACVWLGLLIPSIAAFIIYALLAGQRRWPLVALWGFALPVGLTLFFIYVANVLIPLGPLTFLL